MLALVHQAHVQRAAACALHELESRRDALELEMERQQETDLQVSCTLNHCMAACRTFSTLLWLHHAKNAVRSWSVRHWRSR